MTIADNQLIFFLRKRNSGDFSIESVGSKQENPESTQGFIRFMPEIAHATDITDEVLERVRNELNNVS